MTFFLNFHLGLSRSLRSNDLGWLNFEVATSKVWHCFSKFGSSPQKGKVDLCTTNGSKVLIYLTLQYFKLLCTLLSNAKVEIVGEWVLKRRPFWIKILHILSILLGRFCDKKAESSSLCCTACGQYMHGKTCNVFFHCRHCSVHVLILPQISLKT